MPCNIGYRSYSKARIPSPTPQDFKSKTEAPKVDADLLSKIGEEDPEFLEWMREIDSRPLAEEALKRTLEKIGDTNGVNFSIDKEGNLIAKAKYTSGSQKKKIEKTVEEASGLFQMEVLGVAAQLLNYKIFISQQTGARGDIIVLECEKTEDSNVHKYIQVVKEKGEDAVLRFEHFESKKSLDSEINKFVGLAQKLGIKISLTETKKNGSPISSEAVHKDFLKNGQ